MKLYLMRHGATLSADVAPKRVLSKTGIETVTLVGRRLRELGVAPTEIRHSVKVRAAQTAEIVASELEVEPKVMGQQGLSPEDPVEPLAREVQDLTQDVMIVGHQPFLQRLAITLLHGAAATEPISFPEAGVLVLRRESNGTWSVENQISPQKLTEQQ